MTGWDGVWIADHFMPNAGRAQLEDAPTLEAMSLVAALAASVPRVRIGTAVLGNTYRHPAVVANMAATIDHVSVGRFTLGLGAGWQPNEHTAYGIDLPSVAARVERFEEALAVIHGLLRTSRASFEGRYYRLDGAVCEPKPIQDPLPILVGGSGPRMLEITARWADAWNTYGDPRHMAARSAALTQACERVGRDPAAILRTAQALVVLADDNASRAVLADIDRRVQESAAKAATGPVMPIIGGTAAQLRDVFAAYEEAGVGEFIVPDRSLGTGAAKLECMDRFLEQVARPFRSLERPGDFATVGE